MPIISPVGARDALPLFEDHGDPPLFTPSNQFRNLCDETDNTEGIFLSPLQSTFGPIRVGSSMATFLFGVLTVQMHIYYKHQEFSGDPPLLKLLVVVVWLTELTHQIFLGHLLHWFTISCFGTLNIYIIQPPPTFSAVILTTTITAFLVSTFFLYRIWASTRNVVCAAVGAILITGRFVASCIAASFSIRALSFTAFLTHGKSVMITAWACSAASDLFLTLALCYNLHSRQRAAIYRTAKIIDRLMMLCVATGMLTSISTIALTICFLTMDNGVWAAFFLPISRMFSTSLLVSLNARKSLRHAGSSMIIEMESRSQASHQQGSKDSSSWAPLQVMIMRETFRNTPNLRSEEHTVEN